MSNADQRTQKWLYPHRLSYPFAKVEAYFRRKMLALPNKPGINTKFDIVESIRTLTSSDFSESSHMLKYDNGGTHTAYFRSEKFLVLSLKSEEVSVLIDSTNRPLNHQKKVPSPNPGGSAPNWP
eukprot:sb/3475740/